MYLITPKQIKQLLEYNPETGRFIWKKRKIRNGMERIDNSWNSRLAGKLVKENKERHGHVHVTLYSHQYMAHRVAWAIFYGRWPNGDIDHINGNPKDNRICNLRIATVSQNLMNSKIHCDNSSGRKGISKDKRSGRWHVYITVNYKRVFSKLFDSFEDAVNARRAAEKKYHGEFARTK